jgi:hypothetical protein
MKENIEKLHAAHIITYHLNKLEIKIISEL